MNITPVSRYFLLGGYDLEMLTIKQMLVDRSDCMVLDKHLAWGNAHLSAYADDLKLIAHKEIFGIELQEDMPLPEHYHRIDHHNDWDDKPSALEQVAVVLGITLDHYQQLVAANDKGYIPAMLALGATEEEIAEIRQRDRAAQGVDEQDERLAELSTDQFLSKYDGLLVVKSLTSRFSPICDRLFPYQRLLIYTDSVWMFYGEGKMELVSRYADEINQKKMFHGGGNNGYIGCVDNAYDQAKVNHFVKQIIKQYEHL